MEKTSDSTPTQQDPKNTDWNRDNSNNTEEVVKKKIREYLWIGVVAVAVWMFTLVRDIWASRFMLNMLIIGCALISGGVAWGHKMWWYMLPVFIIALAAMRCLHLIIYGGGDVNTIDNNIVRRLTGQVDR